MKINVAYKRVLVYDLYGAPLIYEPNTSDLDIFKSFNDSLFTTKTISDIESKFGITFPYTYKSNESSELRRAISLFHSHAFPFYKFNDIINYGTVDEFIKKDVNFIYPIMLLDSHIFELDTITLPDNLIEPLKRGKAKIVFTYNFEGHFGIDYREFKWLSNLSKKYGLNKNNNIIITGNLISNDIKEKLINQKYIEDNFTIVPFSWFGYNLFFHKLFGGEKMVNHVRKTFNDTLTSFIKQNRKDKKAFHFLTFNRIPKIHRLCIFGELQTNEVFKDKFITSLGSTKILNDPSINFYNMIENNVNNSYKHDKQKLLDFYSKYNQEEHYVYDASDLHNNKAEALNYTAHGNSFVNIVNESLIGADSVFFSEKMYKPIYCCQPFILFGNPYSLKKLKEYGYKTFDKWWDESYDLETDFTKRLEKIIDVMIEISSWSRDDCFRITNEMEEILTHNFNVMLNDDDTIELFKILTKNEE